MKRQLHLFVTGLMLAFSSFATAKEALIEIRTANPEEVNLLKVVDGSSQRFAKAEKRENGGLFFKFTPEATGFYTLRAKGIESKDLLVREGSHIILTIRDNQFRLVRKTDKENRVLEEWQDMTQAMAAMALPPFRNKVRYEEFFKTYDKFTANAEKVLKKTGKSEAGRLLKEYITFQKELYLLGYVFKPIRVGDPDVCKAYPEYYKKVIQPDKFPDATILKMPFGLDYLMRYVNVAAMLDQRNARDKDALFAYVRDPETKGVLVVNLSNGIKTFIEAEETYNKYKEILNERQEENFRRILDRLDRERIRTDFVDFSFPDVNGKKYSAADFKGKVILLDFWATWCNPCRAEIPYLKELKEYFKGKDIVFIGLSVDRPRDKEKWEKFLIDNAMPDYQLFAGEGGETIKHYNIQSIPRFMIIGKDGKLAAPNAPKPSDPVLKQLLEQELKLP